MVEGMISPPHARRRFLRLAGATAAAAMSLRASRAEEQNTSAPASPPAASASATAFEEVWQTVRDRFYDLHLHGLDWPAIRERYRSDAAQATSETVLAEVINRMLSELQASHTRYYTPDEPEYYQLADIFAQRCGGTGWSVPSRVAASRIPALASSRTPAHTAGASSVA